MRDAAASRGDVRRRPARAGVSPRGPDRRARTRSTDPAGDATRPTCWGRSRCSRRPVSAGARRLVNTSTGGGLYGDADLLPTPEDYPIRPLAPYGQSKYAAEGYCELYTRLHGLSTVSLRYGNVYGPRQDVHGEAGVVAIFCGHLVEGRTPTVFGDGRQTRDWVDVSDVVRANLLAADCELTGPVNIGHGQETSVLDLLTRCATWPTSPCPTRVRARAAGRGAAQLSGREPCPARAGLGAAGAAARRAADDPRRALGRDVQTPSATSRDCSS